MKHIRILSIIETLGRGGAERLLVTQHRHLNRERFAPQVATLFGPNPLAEEIRALAVPVHELDLGGPGSLPFAIRSLRRLIRDERIGIVHTHLYWANVAGRLAAPPGVRVVSTLHNPDYSHEDNGTLRFRLRKRLDGWTGRHRTHAFVAVSGEVKNDFERHLGFRRIRVIHNFTDLRELLDRVRSVDRAEARRELGHRPSSVVVLHVGRHHAQKGLEVLVPAFARARRSCPSLALELVGDGPERRRLEAQAAGLVASGAVRFRGEVADVTPFLAAADVFVFPSWYEAFGIALLEAMAAGLPSIASEVGGILELASTESAWFVRAGDESDLASALAGLGEDPALRRSLGLAASERAKGFDVRYQLPELEELYGSL